MYSFRAFQEVGIVGRGEEEGEQEEIEVREGAGKKPCAVDIYPAPQREVPGLLWPVRLIENEYLCVVRLPRILVGKR